VARCFLGATYELIISVGITLAKINGSNDRANSVKRAGPPKLQPTIWLKRSKGCKTRAPFSRSMGYMHCTLMTWTYKKITNASYVYMAKDDIYAF
jgi:hypothetical protein